MTFPWRKIWCPFLKVATLVLWSAVPLSWAADAPTGRAERAADPAPHGDFKQDIKPLLDRYCARCHGAFRQRAGLNLSHYPDIDSFQAKPKFLETFTQQLRESQMPPVDSKQPTPEERDKLVQYFAHAFDTIDFDKIEKNPGRTLIHRLNRAEYNNTVRDLLGVTTNPADKFPADGGGGGGFDNTADTLYIPPILMERYLITADEVIEAADPQRLFVVRPGAFTTKKTAARKNLEQFAYRAFRRPVAKEEVQSFFALYEQSHLENKTWEESVKFAFKAMLISPHFLFRAEEEKKAEVSYRLSDFELANRLSYFLWSSMPDETLFRLAEKKQLGQPKILEAQVRRMLADPKAYALAENFAGQWLGLRKLKTNLQPDPGRFPKFTASLRDSMIEEPIRFFDHLVRSNQSVLHLLDSDYLILNQELAEFYEIPQVTGTNFVRVTLSDKNRGGVLGMAGILTLTSYPQRTSPVLRGKWVLEEILGTPPPPPPPLVKSLSADDHVREGKSFRERLEAHRADPQCASCHRKMDPLGFGLENYDAIGRWRTKIQEAPVDAKGVLTSGEEFEGPAALKKILLEKKRDLFVRNLTEKMLGYALGRGLEFYDIPTVKKITENLKKTDFHSQDLILEIVRSFPFQNRKSQALSEPRTEKPTETPTPSTSQAKVQP